MGKLLSIFAILSLFLTGCTIDDKIKQDESIVQIPQSGEKINSGEIAQNLGITLQNPFNILKLTPKDQNYMISPFSLKMAMSLAANGAKGETQREILDAFGINNLNEFNENAKSTISKYKNFKETKLDVANSIWLNKDVAGKDIKFTKSYSDLISNYYEGIAKEESAKTISKSINSWVESKTNNKIKNLMDESKKAEYLAVLVNTIYFKGTWMEPFFESATKKDTFTSRDGTKAQIYFMNKKDRLSFYEDSSMKMVKLPYSEGRTSMYFVIPETPDNMDINKALDNMKSYEVRLSIPKFKTEYSLSFVENLNKLGISKAFEPWKAEFKDTMFENVPSNENVYIDDVLQKTFIEVDEKGTEAAAATAVIMNKETSVMPRDEELKEFKADKPFIYFIMDDTSKEVLFIGEYAYTK